LGNRHLLGKADGVLSDDTAFSVIDSRSFKIGGGEHIIPG